MMNLIKTILVGSIKNRLFVSGLVVWWVVSLTSESVEGTSLSLKSIDNIHGGDSLSLGVFSVGNSISDHILKEYLQDSTGLLVDESRDTLDSTTTR